MAFIDERAKVARKPAYICDVFWDTGTIRYCDFAVPPGEAMQSLINKVKTAPTRKSTGSGVGSRAIYNITLNDTTADDGVGTVLGRQLAAAPFFHKRRVDIYVGYLTDPFDIANFQKRTYFIDNITPLNDRNTITINTIDPLEALNDKRSIVPIASFGKLAGALGAGTTGSTNIGDTTNFDASGYCVIDDEFMTYTLVSGTNINITSRGQLGTPDSAHSIDASVTNSYVQINVNVVDAIRTLIEDFTDIDPTFIPDAQWDQERDDYLLAEQMDLVVPTSKSVKSIINQLAEQAGVSIWWDERVSEIPLKSDVPAIFPEFELNTEQNVLDNGHKQTQNMQRLVTRVIYHFNKINKLGEDKQENFEDTLEVIDVANEANQQDRGIVEIFGSYTRTTGTAQKVASRLINRRNNGAREVFWKMDPKDGDVWTGTDIRLTSDLFQDENGLDRAFSIEVVEVRENDGLSYSYKGTIISEEAHNLYALIGPNSLVDFTLETQMNKDMYGFISTNEPNPVMGDGSAAYRIL